jgi:hypothetical protein
MHHLQEIEASQNGSSTEREDTGYRQYPAPYLPIDPFSHLSFMILSRPLPSAFASPATDDLAESGEKIAPGRLLAGRRGGRGLRPNG